MKYKLFKTGNYPDIKIMKLGAYTFDYLSHNRHNLIILLTSSVQTATSETYKSSFHGLKIHKMNATLI